MRSPYERMQELAGAGTPFAVATVVRTEGSTPQVVGAKLIVTSDRSARPFGTLGGGCVEADAIEGAYEALSSRQASIREYKLTEELSWNTGLVCGGSMWILAEPGDTATVVDGRDILPAAVAASRGEAPLALATTLIKTQRTWSFGGRVAVFADGRALGEFPDEIRDAVLQQIAHGTPRLIAASPTSAILIEPVTARPQLVVAGGGHVSQAIARQAALLNFDVTILEDRPEFAGPERFAGATVLAGDVVASIASFPYGSQTFLVIATRGHKLDHNCVAAAVRTTVRYIGLLGSRRKTALIAKALREDGVDERRIRDVRAPVGLDLGGRTPAEIALSVLAEIVQIRYAAAGKPLCDR